MLFGVKYGKKGDVMDMEKINFEIRPIFTPSDEICKIFADIDIACGRLIEPNLQYLCRDLDKRYLDVWCKQRNVFAFAAYKATEIIGFTTGFLDGNNMRTSSLYVMPEYHSHGVSSK